MSTLEKLHPGLQRWVKEQNWNGLRPIQEVALEPLFSGVSCVIEAPTAGGKTEAVLFPTLTRAAQQPQDSVQVLYIAPLRALLNNLEGRGEGYARCCGLHAFKWHGDVSQTAKVASLQSPPHLLLTTPESIEAILLRKPGWRRFFRDIQTVIIDEAHNFASGNRGGHLLALLERLERGTGRQPQRIAVSATIGNPDALCQWLTGDRSPAFRIHVPTIHAQRNDFLLHHFYDAAETEDTPINQRAGWRLLETLTAELKNRRVITFVRSRSKAEDFAKAIQKFSHNRIRVQTHHSAVSKFFREEAERLIQIAGEEGIESIISTSTLELGIDIGELDRVIQIDALSSPSAFLQRVGRTGRRPGKPRCFRGMTQQNDDLLLLTATVSLGLEHQSEPLRLRRRAFHLLAHQMLCMALQEHGVTPDSAWQTLRHAHAFTGIKRNEYDVLIQHMCTEEFLREADGALVPGTAAEKRYLKAGWRKLFAVFNTAPLYEVMEGQTQVGTLDTAFVEGLEVPFFFTLAGRLWKAEEVHHDRHTVKAKRAREGNAPKWDSFGGPDIPFETAQRVGEFLHGFRELPSFLDESALAALEFMRILTPDYSGWSPRSIKCITPEGGKIILRTYAGDTLNRTLAKLLEGRGLKVRGNYADVTIEKGQVDCEDLREYVLNALFDVAVMDDTSAVMESLLLSTQRPWPFSPFAGMLPEELVKATLVDLTTDMEGLRFFLKDCVH